MQMIRKWTAIDRLTHWFLIIGVTTATITGLPLYNIAAFGFLGTLREIRLPFGLTIHLVGATLIMAAAVIHVLYRAASRRPTEIMFGLKDVKDLLTITRNWLGITKEYPRLGLHHPGQKAVYWGAAIVGLALAGASGFLLWFPEVAATWHTLAILIHDLAFVLIIVLITGHFILAITPFNWPVLGAMLVTGRVPASWIQHHHPEWAERTGVLEKAVASK